MGHEIAGEVVEVGAEALGGFQVGDRVQVIAAVPCGDCHECRKGWMAVCENQTSIGYQYDGGFAEYMIVPAAVLKVDGLNHIPEGVGFDEASAAEPFACAINAQEQLGIEPGDFGRRVRCGPHRGDARADRPRRPQGRAPSCWSTSTRNG
jgi:L-iditol 2-dehydrogenase